MKHQLFNLLQDEKFLLGFSGGVDSSALFFLLLQYEIDFDLAIVDYGIRKESGNEVQYAKDLAKKYNKKIYILNALKIERNFEFEARKVRYDFFEEIIAKQAYAGLILAHQLNDRLEWFLMQLKKGAGLNTLLGFKFEEKRGKMRIFRPLLEVSKQELYAYCLQNKITFFEDLSNQDERFLRNKFRKLSSFLLENNESGVLSSFQFLSQEKSILYPKIEVKRFASIYYFEKKINHQNLHILDLEFKKMGYVLSKKQKQEILKSNFSCEIASFVLDCDERYIYFDFKKTERMSKEFRDFARKIKIPKRLRINFFLVLKEKQCTNEELKLFFTQNL